MPADPSTIPASITVTNALTVPLKIAGVPVFTAGEVRLITLSAFLLAQKTVVWNAITRAVTGGWMTANASTFLVTDLVTGHQNTENHGGQDALGAINPDTP